MNTKRSKQLVEQAISNLPDLYALRDVRLHLHRALVELKKVEEKKSKKDENTPLKKWQLNLETGKIMAPPMTLEQKKDALAQIDAMIAAEQKKIDNLKKKASDDDMILD